MKNISKIYDILIISVQLYISFLNTIFHNTADSIFLYQGQVTMLNNKHCRDMSKATSQHRMTKHGSVGSSGQAWVRKF
jgi:hypothetical protein